MSEKKTKAERKANTLKAWKIDVRNYEVFLAQFHEDGRIKMKDGRPLREEDEFDCKGSLADILFNPLLKLSVDKAFQAHDLAEKIRAANAHVLLDNKEMEMVRAAYAVITAPTENQLEFFKRIRDAEEVDVREDPKDSIEGGNK